MGFLQNIGQEWWYGLGAFVTVSIFLRAFPKEKIIGWIKPKCITIGKAVSKFLVIRFGKKGAERVEEGIISTLLVVLGQVPLFINEGLLADNNIKKERKRRKRK